MNSLILVAAGSGTRMGELVNKLLLKVNNRPLIWYTLKHIFESNVLDELILVTKKEERLEFINIVNSLPHRVEVKYADGGGSRIESVCNGVKELNVTSSKLLIHDGARPLVPGEAFDYIFHKLTVSCPAVIYALPSVDTIKITHGDFISQTIDRNKIWRAQTPQGFMTNIYRKALTSVKNRENITDDASILEYMNIPVQIVIGRDSYFKITTKEDWMRFKSMVSLNSCPYRIGQGYDIHPTKETRPLYLGGIKISETRGLMGNSDADSLIHAIIDALLGAAGLGDIGQLFPDTDVQYNNISSVTLLKKTGEFIAQKQYEIGNIDSTIIAEQPKLSPHVVEMKKVIAKALNIEVEQINIKATTNERLDAIGRQEGIAALATALLFRRNS